MQHTRSPMFKEHSRLADFVQKPEYEAFIIILVLANSIWLWIDADYNDANLLIHADWQYQVVENLFCLAFVADWILRACALSTWRRGFKSGVFKFDTALVIMMVFEVWILSIVALASGWERAG